MSQHRVFVYGTLMQGLRNHKLMEGSKFCFPSKTMMPSYMLIQFPSNSSPGNITPGLKRNGNARISGEVYLVDDEHFEILDQFEGVGQEYERRKIMLEDGSKAWAYFVIAKKPSCEKGTPSFIEHDLDTNTQRWMGHVEEGYADLKKVA